MISTICTLVRCATLTEYLPGQDSEAPDITEWSVFTIVESLGSCPLDRYLFQTIRHDVLLLFSRVRKYYWRSILSLTSSLPGHAKVWYFNTICIRNKTISRGQVSVNTILWFQVLHPTSSILTHALENKKLENIQSFLDFT